MRNAQTPSSVRPSPRASRAPLAALLLLSFSTTASAQSLDSLAMAAPSTPPETPCARMDGLFLSTPFSLKATHSALGIGIGWDAPGWMVRFDAGMVETPDLPRHPVSVLLNLGGFWKHGVTDRISIYEGVSLGDEFGAYHSFEGHAISLDILVGCVFKTGTSTSFFVEAGSGAALVEKTGAYAGGTTISAGLRYDIAAGKERSR